jgi:hypothetical protein
MATRKLKHESARRIPFLVEEVGSDLVRLDIATGGDSIRDLSRGVKLVMRLAFSSQTTNQPTQVVQRSIRKMSSSLGSASRERPIYFQKQPCPMRQRQVTCQRRRWSRTHVVRPTVPSVEQRELRRYTERPPLLASGSAMSQLGSRQFLRWSKK